MVNDSTGVNGGQSSTPKWIFRVSASYDADDFGITVTGRGVSSGKYVANGIECTDGLPHLEQSVPNL